MTELTQVALADVHVPERLRAIDEDHALAIQASILHRGLINPITVRRTPNGKRKLTLVAGAHRLRAMELLEEVWVDAIIVEADQLDATLIEIEENLFRNDLSALDRAVFVQTYRDVWEKKHGKITRGGDQTANSAVCPVYVLQDEAERGFATVCAERLGVSKRSIELANQIAQNIPPTLRRKLSGTPIADNQSALLKLAKLEPAIRSKAASAFDKAEGDFGKMMDLLVPPAKAPPKADQAFDALVTAWTRCPKAKRIAFLREFATEIEALSKEAADA